MTVCRLALCFMASALVFGAGAVECHVEGIVSTIREAVSRLRAADPESVPMAFWDLDGTIIKGDSSIGLVENGRVCFRGLLEEALAAGWIPIYQGPEAYSRWRKDYDRMTEIGPWLAQSYDAQMFGGVASADLDAFCRDKIRENGLAKWYFASSMAIWKALDEMGVRNYVVSANMEALVRNLAPTLGIGRDRIRGSRTDEVGGRWTWRIQYPVPVGEGKTEAVMQIVRAHPHGVAVAGFGNSYSTDGAFLRHIAVQKLPEGVKPLSVMINGGSVPDYYKGIFRTVEQSEVVGEHCQPCGKAVDWLMKKDER